jgi:hypothetical protein
VLSPSQRPLKISFRRPPLCERGAWAGLDEGNARPEPRPFDRTNVHIGFHNRWCRLQKCYSRSVILVLGAVAMWYWECHGKVVALFRTVARANW